MSAIVSIEILNPNIKRHYLYRHIREDTNSVFYIGIGTKTKKDIQYNLYSRANSKRNRNYYWQNIVKNTIYYADILIESDDYCFIKNKEIEFIKLYGRRDLKLGSLVNMTHGGDGQIGLQHSIKTKELIGKNLKEINIGKVKNIQKRVKKE